MKSAVIVFPGSNCDRDGKTVLEATGLAPTYVWHRDASLPAVDLVYVPGGFSYGDYLRCGAIAARAPIMDAVRDFAAGKPAIGTGDAFIPSTVRSCTQRMASCIASTSSAMRSAQYRPNASGSCA